MDTLVTHPIFGYRVNYRRVLEIQARLLARVLTGELDDLSGIHDPLTPRIFGNWTQANPRAARCVPNPGHRSLAVKSEQFVRLRHHCNPHSAPPSLYDRTVRKTVSGPSAHIDLRERAFRC